MHSHFVLPENGKLRVPGENWSDERALEIWNRFPDQLDCEEPGLANGHVWVLSGKGWIGSIALSDGSTIRLTPKIPISNALAMLDAVSSARGFRLPSGFVDSSTLDEAVRLLIRSLAKETITRCRQGIYKAYVDRRERLPAMRGRLERVPLPRPWQTGIDCRFEEHTCDVLENQLLAWTLWQASRSPALTGDDRRSVDHALRILQGSVSIRELRARDCEGVRYHRLNAGYRPLHGICRLLLEAMSPGLHTGGAISASFLLDMSQVFEDFVFFELRKAVPGLVTVAHHTHEIGSGMRINPDIEISGLGGATIVVLDTKYKADKPENPDVYQVVAYCKHLGCREALLVYPSSQPDRTFKLGNIRVRTAVADLSKPIQNSVLSLASLIEQLQLKNLMQKQLNALGMLQANTI